MSPGAQAMILAAGLGTRMRPLTDHQPKALVTVAGKALIDYAIDRLIEAGVRRLVVNLHYCADPLEAHLRRRRDIAVTLSDERAQLLDTGGGLAKALPHFGGHPFLTLNCDSLWLETVSNVSALQNAWAPDRMDGIMLLCAREAAVGYDGPGDFELDQGGRIAWRQGDTASFVWTGVQILHPRLLAGCPEGPFSTRILWDRAIAAGRLFGLRFDGTWLHVGTPEAVREAEAILAHRG